MQQRQRREPGYIGDEEQQKPDRLAGRTLIFFSAGFDSTALLLELLCNPKYKDLRLHVHHITMKSTMRDQWKLELQASRRIIDMLEERFDPNWTYTENTLVNVTGDHMMITRTEAAKLCKKALSRRDPYVFIATGRNAIDFRGNFDKRANVAHERFLNAMRGYSKPFFLYPIRKWDKTAIVSHIRESKVKELHETVWTCSAPKLKRSHGRGVPQYQHCGQCLPCRDIEGLVDDAFFYRKTALAELNDNDMSMRPHNTLVLQKKSRASYRSSMLGFAR